MKRRVLSNGMTVFLYPRRDATGSLEVRLVVRAGSLQETEEERGLAHYVEHMAFNGTRDFPDQSAFKALEADGIMLGADVSAVTSLGALRPPGHPHGARHGSAHHARMGLQHHVQARGLRA